MAELDPQRNLWRRLRRRLRPLASRPLMAVARRVAPPTYRAYMRLVFATSRVDVGDFSKIPAACDEHGGLVQLFLHEGVMNLGYGYHYAGVRAWGLVSLGDAGDVLSGVLEGCGHGVVRGGSSRRQSRRNANVLAEMISLMSGRDDVVFGFAVDGTHGPAYRVKRGGLVVARECGVPVQLVRIWARHNLRLSSWDRFAIPLPFNEIRFHTAGPFAVPAEARDEAGLERFRRSMELALVELAIDSHRALGQDIPPELEAARALPAAVGNDAPPPPAC